MMKNVSRKKTNQEPKIWVKILNDLMNQEKFLKSAKSVLEQETLCLQIDKMKLRASLRQVKIKVEPNDFDDECKEEVDEYKDIFDAVSNEQENSRYEPVSLPEPYSIQIKGEPVANEELQHVNTKHGLFAQTPIISKVKDCYSSVMSSHQLEDETSRRNSSSGFDDYLYGNLQIMETEDRD
ncbi:uncharacterized protein LOC129222171 [Uloborus diversus]|uniref:uncharacterized protein LOC129222171 n=1 Tax=Uloborus diversus TaxID=327109 RepID=UPI00240A2BC0|nr:uncharacterized protein LOC129222171 [Uloborus diversus]